ncbi:MAG TPA: lamin tail domain-containing protein [Anaerolineales bacterium]|nr:lamin tail domain-containing protein [Anaerolineales bacterium]
MDDKKHWLPFILLNIFVSAAVTGAILFWYDRTYRQATIPAATVSISVPTGGVSADIAPATPAATLDPEAEINVEIVSVIGAGTFEAEMVLVRYNGEGELHLEGWTLKDEDKNVYDFPKLTLYPAGAVQIHTMAGQDTVVDLYWGLRQSVWQSGEEVKLIDSQGTERASYKVP